MMLKKNRKYIILATMTSIDFIMAETVSLALRLSFSTDSGL